MNKRGRLTGIRRGDRERFPYEPRVVAGRLLIPPNCKGFTDSFLTPP